MIVVYALLLLGAAAPEVEIRTVDGDAVTGRLIELSATSATLETDSGTTTIDGQKMLSLGPRSAATAKSPESKSAALPVSVNLVDGSTVPAAGFSADARKARLLPAQGDPLEIDLRDIAAVRLQAGEPAVEQAWRDILAGKHVEDILVIRKENTLDYHKGVVHEVNDSSVQFEMDGEKIAVKRAKVFGIVYFRPPRDLPGALCTITDVDGGKWAVRTLSFDGQLRWTAPCGIEVKKGLDSIANIDFSAGKIVFLSELKPDSVRWTPFFAPSQPLPSVEEFYAPRSDQNFSAQPLRLRGEKYAKGLAIHSRTEMVYRLPGRFSRFRAIAGIDDEVAPNGHVRLVIRADDQTLFDEAISGSDAPKSIDLDISNAKRLVILVDFGEKLDVGDHLVLALARISK